MKDKTYKVLNSISELHAFLKLKKPTHPLVSVIRAEEVTVENLVIDQPIIFNFYVVSVKSNCPGKLKYGQQYYDFDEGVMYFMAQEQLLYATPQFR